VGFGAAEGAQNGVRAARPGVVYLVGAGPGDPGLVTQRGLELLRSADVVLHDELIDLLLLRAVRHDAEVICVGKRGTRPTDKQRKQGEIEAMLVAHAGEGRSVVRLKGGDPFLFGRGSEEAAVLSRAGIAFEVVPGVSSALAAATHAGISLTHRDLATSVTFVTARTRDGKLFDFAELAAVRGTLCVFMSLGAIDEIARALVASGRAASTPAAMISNATMPEQRVVVATLADIAAEVARADIITPAILIVGDVVGLREQISWFDSRPLFGKRVLVTRAAHQAGEVVSLVRSRGGRPVVVPMLRIGPAPDPAAVTRAVSELGSYDAVVFTSENGVARFFDALAGAGRDARAFGAALVAAIGGATRDALRSRGIEADLVPASAVGESLAAALIEALAARRGEVRGARILLPRARVARDVVPDALRAHGATVDVVAVYETLPPEAPAKAELIEALRTRSIDVVLLMSSSAVTGLRDLVGDLGLLAPVTLASIGDVTTRTATELGLHVAVTAPESTLESLVSAVEAHLQKG
jgi:uroporphyrinogen III methyltransferase / synthase